MRKMITYALRLGVSGPARKDPIPNHHHFALRRGGPMSARLTSARPPKAQYTQYHPPRTPPDKRGICVVQCCRGIYEDMVVVSIGHIGT